MEFFNKYFIDVIKNKYADFEGRARRSEYWYFTLSYFILTILIFIVIGAVSYASPSAGVILYGIVALLSLGLFIPSLALGVRRLHDTGKSGWMYLIGLIPLLGPIILIVFYCTEGTPGPNQYGPNPKELDQDELVDHLIK